MSKATGSYHILLFNKSLGQGKKMEKLMLDQQYLLQVLSRLVEKEENRNFDDVTEIVNYLVSQLKPIIGP